MINNRFLLKLVALVILVASCTPAPESGYVTKTAEEGGYTYEYVTNDPMKTRIYRLENGLTVYLSVYKDAPRIQSYFPVRAGGAYDPADNTGLAHYLEHIMFKGTADIGTTDWDTESVLLDSIENMFNHYASLTEDEERKEYYNLIDQVSNRAAEYAIANEYDKMISEIGGKYLNAWTSYDETVYTVDIPSNELQKFLQLESNRFRMITPRLFHTELEAVYEEKNMGLDSDFRKSFEAMFSGMFKVHPYGTQTVIGTIDHLKNPSITEIKKYFDQYYRPNNVAICLSGDLDPTQTIQWIEEYYSDWEPTEIEPKVFQEEPPIEEPVVREVWGPEAENIMMGFRFGGIGSDDHLKVKLVDMMLNNSEAGLIDLELMQKQKVLSAGSFVWDFKDYSTHIFQGKSKDGQELDEVRDLILEQIDRIKAGDFEDWLIDAVIADFKKSSMRQLEYNYARANQMVSAFINDQEWIDMVSELDRMEKITREDIIQFVNDKYSDNYVIVYKRNGEDPNKRRVEKPAITKVPLNRDDKSEFHIAWLENEAPELSPVFVDYEKDINRASLDQGLEILSAVNKENELFNLDYLLDMGSNNDPKMKVAVQYLEFIGTDTYTAEELKIEFYKLGCSYSVYAGNDRTYVSLSGLDENMEQALVLFEDLLKNPKPDQEALDKMIERTLKSREDAKKSKGTILWSGLYSYGEYGAESPFTNVLSNAELMELQASELTELIRQITEYDHRVLYYGPRTGSELAGVLRETHVLPSDMRPLPEPVEFEQQETTDPKVYWTHYDMVQSEMIFMSKGEEYDKSIVPQAQMFNEYYGGGMNSVVFQEIREAQGLAYSVWGGFTLPSKLEENNQIFAYVGTQSDKQVEAMAAIMDIMNNMPESEESFNIAKDAILSKLESERITKSGVIWNYLSAERLNLDYDIRKDIYNQVQDMTLADLKEFHDTYIKDRSYVTVLMGNREKINFDDLKKYGEIQELSLEEIFGYEDVERIDMEISPETD